MRCIVLAFLLLPFIVPPLVAQDDQPEVYEPPRDYGVDWRASALLEYSSEDGLLIGGGPILYTFGFRKLPYVYRMQLVGGVALKTGALKFEYTALYPAVSGILSAHVLARFSEVEVRNFYGFGNDSRRDRELDRARFYRVDSREVLFNPMLWMKAASNVKFGGGIVLKHFAIRKAQGLSPGDIVLPDNNRWFLGGKVSVEGDTRDREFATTSGVLVYVAGESFPDVFENTPPFHRVSADARAFVTADMGIPVTLALRAGGTRVYGKAPFYEAALIGGPGTLRGFNAERFAGDAAAFVNTDVRATLFRMKLFVPTTVGVFALCDAGRVWVDGNSPGTWHASIGGGISLAPIDPSATVIITLAHSKDGLFVTGGLGFGF